MTLCAASQFRGESYRVRHVLMQEGWPLKKRARFRYPDCSNPFDETQLSRLSSGGVVTTVLAVDLRMSVRSQYSGGMGLINSMLRLDRLEKTPFCL